MRTFPVYDPTNAVNTANIVNSVNARYANVELLSGLGTIGAHVELCFWSDLFATSSGIFRKAPTYSHGDFNDI